MIVSNQALQFMPAMNIKDHQTRYEAKQEVPKACDESCWFDGKSFFDRVHLSKCKAIAT